MYEIAVIGCGASGLNSALALQRTFGPKANITIFAKDQTPNITSNVAGGLWEPGNIQNTPSSRTAKWSRGTLEYLKKLWLDGKAKEAGITLQPIVNLYEEENFKLPEWLNLTLGYSELSEKQLNEYRNLGLKSITGGFVFTSFVWEGSTFLPYLQNEFIRNGGKIVKQIISDFSDLKDYDLIVNCTGVHAKDLSKDEEVYPIRGQVCRVEAPWLFQTILIPRLHPIYIITNTNWIVLGCTKNKRDYNLNVNNNDKYRIIQDCNSVVPALENVKILKDCVGLRPGRVEVRLELERMIINGKIANIIHNYGHGGGGITMSVGCAQEVAELAKEALTATKSKL